MSDFYNLHKAWKLKKIPLICGIIYENGFIDLARIESSDTRIVQVTRRVDALSIANNPKCLDVIIDVLNFAIDFERKYIVSCGGGQNGDEGFVSLEIYHQEIVKWVAFFYGSNPFDKVEITEDKIVAYNNINEKWIFDLDKPSNIVIENIRAF